MSRFRDEAGLDSNLSLSLSDWVNSTSYSMALNRTSEATKRQCEQSILCANGYAIGLA